MVLALFAAVLLTPAAGPLQLEKLERSTDAMGATFSVVLYGSDQTSMNEAIDAAFEEAHRLDALLSNYRPASEWSRINREAAAYPVAAPPKGKTRRRSIIRSTRMLRIRQYIGLGLSIASSISPLRAGAYMSSDRFS